MGILGFLFFCLGIVVEELGRGGWLDWLGALDFSRHAIRKYVAFEASFTTRTPARQRLLVALRVWFVRLSLAKISGSMRSLKRVQSGRSLRLTPISTDSVPPSGHLLTLMLRTYHPPSHSGLKRVPQARFFRLEK